MGNISQWFKTIKDAIYISKTVNTVRQIRQIFETICQEKLGKIYAMVLYSPTRWKSVKYMLQSLSKEKQELCLMESP